MTVHLFDGFNFIVRHLWNDKTGYPDETFKQMVFDIKNQSADPFWGKPLQIWCFDGPNALEYRRKIYPGYKMKRRPFSEDIGAFFKFAREFLETQSVPILQLPEYEADDLILSYCNFERDRPIYIWSNDRDMIQCVQSNVTLEFPVPNYVKPYDIRLFKTFVGDQSDNIPGLPKFGKASWIKSDVDELYELIEFIENDVTRNPTYFPKVFTSSQIDFLCEEENRKLLLSYWLVQKPLIVPENICARYRNF